MPLRPTHCTFKQIISALTCLAAYLTMSLYSILMACQITSGSKTELQIKVSFRPALQLLPLDVLWESPGLRTISLEFQRITSEFPKTMLEVLIESFREIGTKYFEATAAKRFRPEPAAHFLVLDLERPIRHAMRREGKAEPFVFC